jgi:hypothetical protein
MKKAVEMLEAIADEKRSFNPSHGSFWSWKLNFVTLTLPAAQGSVSDSDLRRYYFNHFLTLFRRKYQPKGYVWRMEAQSNGNAHFHLICDKWIDKDSLRSLWNHVLSKGHFIESYRKKYATLSKEAYVTAYMVDNRKSREKAEKAYQRGIDSQWTQPNTTDIHSTHGIQQVTNYLGKYLSKKDGTRAWVKENISTMKFEPVWSEIKRIICLTPYFLTQYRPIIGKLWGCSENLQCQKGIQGDWDDGDDSYLLSAERENKVGSYIGNHFKIYYQRQEPLERFLPPSYRLKLKLYIKRLKKGQPDIFEEVPFHSLYIPPTVSLQPKKKTPLSPDLFSESPAPVLRFSAPKPLPS